MRYIEFTKRCKKKTNKKKTRAGEIVYVGLRLFVCF